MHEIFPVFLLIFLIGIWASGQFFRYRRRALVHKERLLAIEKGLDLPPDTGHAESVPPQVSLLRGLLWLLGGIAWIFSLLGIAALLRDNDRTVAASCAMGGLIPIGLGCAYLLYYRLQSRK